ncbi:TonB-dependent siderophore receptor [Arcobacter sp.]|uniref:TonB-dependent siderophore receptor n=1 Tax=unclassified Arcobacter TaxID=2593671 RepID=UPI003B00AB66
MKNKKTITLSLLVILTLQCNLFSKEKEQSTLIDTIKVSTTSDSAITEDTGSYTSKSMSTSTNLNLSIKNTPQSVSVITSQELEDKDINSYQDMLGEISGVSIDRWDERVYPTARGFRLDNIKIDGKPSSAQRFSDNPDLSIYDHIEIVKGANGLTTGAGEPGISINLIRKHANSKKLVGEVTLNAGSWDSYSQGLDIATPLNTNKNIRGRVVLKHEKEHSFFDRYSKKTDLIYGVIDADLSDSTYLSIGASYQNRNTDGARLGGLPALYSDGTRTNFSRSTALNEDWTYWDQEDKSIFLDLKQYFNNDITLNASYGFNKKHQDTHLLQFYGLLNKLDGSGISYREYMDETIDEDNNFDINLNVPFEINSLNQEIVLGYNYNKYANKLFKYKEATYSNPTNKYQNPIPNFNNYTIEKFDFSNAQYTEFDPEKTTQNAIYLVGNFSLHEKLKLITGARITTWRYTSQEANSEQREFKNQITPYAGLVYDINGTHSLYVSYTDIFKPQTSKDENGNYLDPVIGKNYETGIKGEYFGGKLNTSLSIFKIMQDNVAQSIPDVYVPGTTRLASKMSHGVVTKGVEFEASGEINDRFSLDFAIASFSGKDAEGERVETKSSRTTANIFAKYKINDFNFGAGINYKSRYYNKNNKDVGPKNIEQKGYFLVNTMANYKLNKNTLIQLNINNLFDKKYYEGVNSFGLTYGNPRNYTLTLKYKF